MSRADGAKGPIEVFVRRLIPEGTGVASEVRVQGDHLVVRLERAGHVEEIEVRSDFLAQYAATYLRMVQVYVREAVAYLRKLPDEVPE